MARLVVRAARLLDGRGSAPVPEAALICEDGRIAYAGPETNALGPAPGDTVVDAGSGTLIPGLIDCHVHLCFDGSADFAAEAGDLNAAIDEAHEAGIRVATHAHGAEGIVRALRAGVDTVEHGSYLTDEALKL